MGDFDSDYSATPVLGTMVDGAKQFGLTDAEVLAALDLCVYEVGTDATVEELLDELSGVLARSIIGKQRRTLSDGEPVDPDRPRDRSKDPR
jgi:hypothetical protein